jgi:NO-binding membrane sensor protein with MHYT domain
MHRGWVPDCPTDVLTTHWVTNIVALGIMISVISAFTGLTTATYAFTVLRRPDLIVWYRLYSVSAGVSLGGGAIWVMHFVGMEALHQQTPCGDVIVGHQFNALLTFISFFAACAIGSLCMILVMPEYTSADANQDDFAESPFWRLPFNFRGHALYIGRFSPKRFAAAVVALAVGVVVMHNMGLIAMYGPYWVEYDAGIVIASAVLAIVASAAGLFVVVQCAYVGAKWYSLILRAAAAVMIALAVNAVHYTVKNNLVVCVCIKNQGLTPYTYPYTHTHTHTHPPVHTHTGHVSRHLPLHRRLQHQHDAHKPRAQHQAGGARRAHGCAHHHRRAAARYTRAHHLDGEPHIE